MSSTRHSLALKHILRRLRASGGTRILDLGPAIGKNVTFFSSFATKIFIADLYHTLRKQPGRPLTDRSKLERILARDLPSANDGPIDLVLAWDLLNYLEREQVSVLGKRLAHLCSRDSLIFALISTTRQIPELPTRFVIVDAETLKYENDAKRERQAPLYKEPDLERLMPAFEVETSFLLRHGVQEYVVTTRSAPSARTSNGGPYG